MVLRSFSASILAFSIGLVGCGSSAQQQQSCPVSYPVTVTPSSATLDHMATGPGNQIQFVGVGVATSPEGCPQGRI